MQADVYDQKPCSLDFFPLTHRKDLVREAAIALNQLHGPCADHYWISNCRSLASQLSARGCPEHRIRAEIMAFQETVLSALVAMNGGSRSPTVMQA